MAESHPDRAGDGQDEVRLVAMSEELYEGCWRALGEGGPSSQADDLDTAWEDGITEEEARILVTAVTDVWHVQVDTEPNPTTATRVWRKLRMVFPTQKDTSDG